MCVIKCHNTISQNCSPAIILCNTDIIIIKCLQGFWKCFPQFLKTSVHFAGYVEILVKFAFDKPLNIYA